MALEAEEATCLSPGGILTGNGKVETERRDVEPFHTIEANGFIHLRLMPGKEPGAIIKGESNLLPHFHMMVRDGILRIDFDRPVRVNEPIDIRLRAPDVTALTLGGKVEVSSVKPLAGEVLKLHLKGGVEANLKVEGATLSSILEGGSIVNLQGSVQEHHMVVSGASRVSAQRLQTATTTATVSGSARLDLYASEGLDFSVSGTAEITYRGEAEVMQAVKGLATVHALDQ